jgi:hypothetical protein
VKLRKIVPEYNHHKDSGIPGYYFKIGHNCYNPLIIKLYYFHVPMNLVNFLGTVDTTS